MLAIVIAASYYLFYFAYYQLFCYSCAVKTIENCSNFAVFLQRTFALSIIYATPVLFGQEFPHLPTRRTCHNLCVCCWKFMLAIIIVGCCNFFTARRICVYEFVSFITTKKNVFFLYFFFSIYFLFCIDLFPFYASLFAVKIFIYFFYRNCEIIAIWKFYLLHCDKCCY